MSITFSYADRKLSIENKRRLKNFIPTLFASEQKELGSLTYVFCSDDYLLKINQDFLKHDFYTDIITFDLGNDLSEGVVGEIYISVDRVKENSLKLKASFLEEMLRVVFHGALHLCGYKDKKKSEILIMRQKEADYLRLYETINLRST